MWRNVKTSRGATVFLTFLFIAMPLIMVPSAIDPDVNPRTIALSVFSAILFFTSLRKSVIIPDSFKGIGMAALGILFIALISVFNAINPGEAIAEWLRILIIYIFLFASVSFFQNSDLNLRTVLRFISLSVLIFSGFAIVQSLPVVEAILEHKKIVISSDIASTLSNKNFFSEVLVLLIPAIFFAIFKDEKRFVALHIAAFFCAAFFIFFLTSLGCWIAVFVSTIIIATISLFNRSADTFNLQKKTKITIAVTTIVLLVIGSVVIRNVPIGKNLKFKVDRISGYISDPSLLDKNIYANNNSVFDRLLMIRNSLRMIGDHPLIGVGMNNWKLIFPYYGVGGTEILNSGGMNFEHPHNDYLLIMSEQGVFGLIAYLLFFYFIFRTIRHKLKTASGEERTFIYVIFFAVLSFMIMSAFSYPRSRIYTPVILMFYISLLFVNKNEKENTLTLKPLLIYLIILFCLASTAVSAIRLNSEIHAKKMLKAKYQSNFARVMRESEKINTYFYPLEYSSSSIDWFKGMALFYSGQIPAALESYKLAIQKTPYHLRTLNDLATSYEQSGLPDSAISLYRRALAISPYLNDSRFNLSATYFNQNKIDSAYNVLNFISYKDLNIGPQENYVKFMGTILTARIQDSLQTSSDSSLVSEMTAFINDIPRTKRYIRAYNGRTIWPDVFTDKK